MIRLTYVFCAFFAMCIASAYAQGSDVSGTVTDSSGNPLEFANILLLKASDSVMIAGTSADEKGRFLFTDVLEGSYFLQVSHLGFKPEYLPLQHPSSSDVGAIALVEEPEYLGDVNVRYIRPTLQKKADRIVFNVEGTTIADLNSYEILKRTPGVIIVNGEIRVRNTKPVVYINDRRVFLEEGELRNLLQGLGGGSVSAVEVITNPPASYDAEGGTVLNIKMSRNLSIGYKGAVNGSFTQAVFPKYEAGTQHFYKTDKLNFFMSYQYADRKNYKRDENYTRFFDGPLRSDEWLSKLEKEENNKVHTVQAILDTKIGSGDLSLSGNLSVTPMNRYDNVQRVTIFDADAMPMGGFTTDAWLENDNTNYSLNASFDQPLDEEGTHLKFQANYVYYDDLQDQFLDTRFEDEQGNLTDQSTFFTAAGQENNIYTIQSDLGWNWGKWGAEAGVKYSDIQSRSFIDFEGLDVPAAAQDDRFAYDEQIYAAYASVNREWEKWSLNMGLRGEQTEVNANSITLSDINTQSYFELFPNLSLQYASSDKSVWTLSADRSIARPRYQTLNPYRYYLNDNQFQAGNPNLTRAIESRYAFGYTLNDQFIFEVSYAHTDGTLQRLTFQDNENRLLYSAVFNMEEESLYSFDFIYYANLANWWSFNAYASAFYMENRFRALESIQEFAENDTYGTYIQAGNSFTLDKESTWTADLQVVYLSDFIFGSFKLENRLKTDMGLRKSLWDNRASLSLNVNDIFDTNNVEVQSRYFNQDNGFLALPESRKVTVSFRYNFGNFRLSDNNRRTTPAEAERLN